MNPTYLKERWQGQIQEGVLSILADLGMLKGGGGGHQLKESGGGGAAKMGKSRA